MTVINEQNIGVRLILLGPPGAGKGTQAKLLSNNLKITHIASGDLFRHHQNEGTVLGGRAKEYMAKGLLVPDEITIEMVLDKIKTLGSTGFLLDGFPRNVAQAIALDDALAVHSKSIDNAILIRVPYEELVNRLSGRFICSKCQAPYHVVAAPPTVTGICNHCNGSLYQRKDDTREAIEVRLSVYSNETEPLVDRFSSKGKLIEIDGIGTIGDIGRRLINALEEHILA